MVNDMPPGRRAEFPKNLLNTWIDYRISIRGESLAELINEVNHKLKKKYSNHSFWTWKKGNVPIPSVLIENIIYPELADVLRWYFKRNGLTCKDADFSTLAKLITSPSHPDALAIIFDFLGVSHETVDLTCLSASIST